MSHWPVTARHDWLAWFRLSAVVLSCVWSAGCRPGLLTRSARTRSASSLAWVVMAEARASRRQEAEVMAGDWWARAAKRNAA